MEPDFSGYATKAGLRCSDGRTITPQAFQHMDGQQVPLVWQHGHNDPANVLGHAILEARPDGVYARGFFNETPSGQAARALVQHKDVNKLSIYANHLVEKAKMVLHGMISEVSLVLSGANPGAVIDYVAVQHADGDVETLGDEAVIHTGLEIDFVDFGTNEDDASVEHAASDKTVQEIYDSFSPEQKDVVAFMIGAALDQAGTGSIAQSDTDTIVEDANDDSNDSDETADEGNLTHQEGTPVARNVFEQRDASSATGATTGGVIRHSLSHSDVKGIVADAVKSGSMREAVEKYALAHGIDDVDLLFPDAKLLEGTPQFEMRRVEWVASVLNGTKHSPFSRVKTVVADLTQEEARAKGYVKGSLKKEEWFGLTKRTTSPTTVYKKQSVDRDDVLDITELDMVVWLKGEMRLMLDEEVARAILIGDGRDISSEDKVKDPVGASDGVGIRSILNDHDLFVTRVNVNVDDALSSYDEVVDAVMNGMEFYKGTGTPTFYTTIRTLNRFLQIKDTLGHRLYGTKAAVADALGVKDIVTVEVMNMETDLLGIIVNLQDYNVGTDRGGEVSMFDDFDIDYNKQKYLIETRLSGALTKIKSAVVVMKTASTDVLLATPTTPTFVASTGVVTLPTSTNFVWKNSDTDASLTDGAQAALDAGEELRVVAVADTGYFFANNTQTEFRFTRTHA
jgi:hypothetical protein